jgi:hypothetical protein
MIDRPNRELVPQTAAAKVLENLPRIPPVEAAKTGLLDFHSTALGRVVF